MTRLLFVHDDARLIDRVSRFIAQREPEWQVRVETSVADAWKAVEQWAPDAIAALARPPRLDGVELLARMQHAHPDTIRIVLGVDRDAEKNLRALRIAHRAVDDPIDPAVFVETVRRMRLLSDLVTRPGVREMLGRIGQLPAVPSVYTKLTQRLEDSNASVFELADLVAADTTLATQVLRIANSAFFNSQQRVTKIEAAAARLGTRLLRSVVLTAEVYARFPVSPFMAERIESLQAHASLVARLASSLEPAVPWKDDAFTAGLLHDIGKLVLASHLGEMHTSIVREAERTNRPEDEVETQRLGIHHGALGACLLGMWGLPSVVIDAAFHHHDPIVHLPQPLDVVTSVAIADRLAHAALHPEGIVEPTRPWPEAVLADPRWPAWRDMAFEAGQVDRAA